MVTVDDGCELNVESLTNEGILAQEHLLLSTTTSIFVLPNLSLTLYLIPYNN